MEPGRFMGEDREVERKGWEWEFSKGVKGDWVSSKGLNWTAGIPKRKGSEISIPQ